MLCWEFFDVGSFKIPRWSVFVLRFLTPAAVPGDIFRAFFLTTEFLFAVDIVPIPPVHWWTMSDTCLKNILLHFGQWNVRFTVCIASWASNWLFVGKLSLHVLHVCNKPRVLRSSARLWDTCRYKNVIYINFNELSTITQINNGDSNKQINKQITVVSIFRTYWDRA